MSNFSARETIAIAAMQALLSNPNVFDHKAFHETISGVRGGKMIARSAFVHADALIEEASNTKVVK